MPRQTIRSAGETVVVTPRDDGQNSGRHGIFVPMQSSSTDETTGEQPVPTTGTDPTPTTTEPNTASVDVTDDDTTGVDSAPTNYADAVVTPVTPNPPHDMPVTPPSEQTAQGKGHWYASSWFKFACLGVSAVGLLGLVFLIWKSTHLWVALPVFVVLVIAVIVVALAMFENGDPRHVPDGPVPKHGSLGLFWRLVGAKLYARFGWNWLVHRSLRDRWHAASNRVWELRHVQLIVAVTNHDGGSGKTFSTAWLVKMHAFLVHRHIGAFDVNENGGNTAKRLGIARAATIPLRQFLALCENALAYLEARLTHQSVEQLHSLGSLQREFTVEQLTNLYGEDGLKEALTSEELAELRETGVLMRQLSYQELSELVKFQDLEPSLSLEELTDLVEWDRETGCSVITTEQANAKSIDPDSMRRGLRVYKSGSHGVYCDFGNGYVWPANLVSLEESSVVLHPARAEADDSLDGITETNDFYRTLPGQEEKLARAVLLIIGARNRRRAEFAARYPWAADRLHIMPRNRYMRKDRPAQLTRIGLREKVVLAEIVQDLLETKLALDALKAAAPADVPNTNINSTREDVS